MGESANGTDLIPTYARQEWHCGHFGQSIGNQVTRLGQVPPICNQREVAAKPRRYDGHHRRTDRRLAGLLSHHSGSAAITENYLFRWSVPRI